MQHPDSNQCVACAQTIRLPVRSRSKVVLKAFFFSTVYWLKCRFQTHYCHTLETIQFMLLLSNVRPHHPCWFNLMNNAETRVVWFVVIERRNQIMTVTTCTPLFSDPQHTNTLAAHFLLRWRATSDFLKPSKLKRRLARRLAAATSAWWLPLVSVSLLLRPSLSLRSWSSSESVARRALSLLRGWVGAGVQRLKKGQKNVWLKSDTQRNKQTGRKLEIVPERERNNWQWMINNW